MTFNPQTGLPTTILRLDDDEFRFRVRQSYGDSEWTIAEWHDFVEGHDLAMRAMRDCRWSEVRHPAKALAGLVRS